jgi:hypothetical protein
VRKHVRLYRQFGSAQHDNGVVSAPPLVRREHWGWPIDTCMLDVRFREFQDAMAVMIGDQERAGLDILTHGDLHVDEDMAGRAWHHYPLRRWAGLKVTISSRKRQLLRCCIYPEFVS